jgi:putative spermidine/putrescine transport system permease protein
VGGGHDRLTVVNAEKIVMDRAITPVGARSARTGAWRRAVRRPIWLALPALALLTIFFAYPVGKIVGRGFTDHTSSSGGALANLSWFFGDATQVEILLRTFQTSAIVTVICLAAGYPYAYLLTVVRPRWRAVMLGIVIVSCWQSILVRNYAWRILERDEGVINSVLGWLGFGHVSLLGTTTGVVIGMSQVMAPFMILPLYANLRNIDRRLLLAARSLGASPTIAFLRAYLPLSLPGILAGSLLVYVLSLGFYITPALLGSPSNALVSQAIVLQINRLLDWGHAGAIAIVLLVATLALLGGVGLLVRRRMHAVSGAAER